MNLHKEDIRRILIGLLFFSVGVILVISLSGCGFNNVTKTSDKEEKQTLKETGFFDSQEKNKGASLNLHLSGNAIANIGDRALEKQSLVTTKKVIHSDSVWDMKVSEAYEQYNTFTFIFIGLGLILMVVALYLFQKTTFGKAVTSATSKSINKIEDLLTYLDTGTDSHKELSKLRDSIARESK